MRFSKIAFFFVVLWAEGWAQTATTNSSAAQNARQANTSVGPGNYDGIKYVTAAYNWSQAPSRPESLSTGVAATVTLAPCPTGVDTSNNANAPYSVYVSGSRVSEPVIVTGGSCTPGAASRTIIFVPASEHAAGYRVQSASGGIQEAINDAGGTAKSGNSNARVMIPASGANIPPGGVSPGEINIYAPVFVHSGRINLSGYGAMVRCFTRSYCFHLGDLQDANHFSEVRIEGLGFDPGVNQDGAQIVNVSRQANVITISTAAAHKF